MSASSKKKLRKDQDAAKLTQRQQAELKEAKKLKIYTAAFVAAVAVMLVVAIVLGVNQTITNKGLREKNTVAVTIGEHKVSNALLNYFYMDIVNQYSSYASYMGVDTTAPLDEQVMDEEAGTTWADYFLDLAKDNAKSAFAMADAANAAGYTLPQAEQDSLDMSLNNITAYATLYGFSDADAYVKAMYGNGASVAGYKEYQELNTLANSYYTAYGESLTYTDEDLRAAEAENYDQYSSYSYQSYYLAANKFLEGGTTDEEGNTTYSDEEKAASVEAAKAAADSLVSEELADVAALDAAIAALSVNAETTASSTAYDDTKYSSVSSTIREWITDQARTEGDRTVIASTTTSTDDEGNETTTTNGYYVVWYRGMTDNTFALKNVRHILVAFEGGTTDDNGNTTYTDAEKLAAKEAAEALLEQWKSGDATEESFAELANAESADGDGTTGGLYQDIYPGQMVEPFEAWCYDETRAAGDTGIVESTYGYHVMYFVGDSDLTYRDYQIDSELRSQDLQNWYTETLEAVTVTDGDTKYISKDLVLSSN